MLLKTVILEKIIASEIKYVFRRWKRESVKSGGTQMTHLGVLGIDAVEVVAEGEISEKDARLAGFISKKELIGSLSKSTLDIYKITVRYIGEDPRKELRNADDLSVEELEEVLAKLRKLDQNSQRGNWTRLYLQTIYDQPNTHAAVLSSQLGLDNAHFKPWVRKLKALGLTESLSPGYQLSPRGEKVLKALNSNEPSAH